MPLDSDHSHDAESQLTPDNRQIYDSSWESWIAMKVHGPASRWLRALILDACRELPDDVRSVHDVGCGEGTNTALLSARFPEAKVRGTDFSTSAIRVAARLAKPPQLEFIHDEENAALSTPADLVTCYEVLEHVDAWQPFLDRMADSAERFLMISTPTGRMRPFEVNVGHMRNFRRGEIEQYLAERGWSALSVAYAGFPFYSPIYRDLCQLTNAGGGGLSRGEYSLAKRALCTAIFWTFRYASMQSRRGDQFVGLFARDKPRS
jgi:SAM-dependent methyltransferase